ncbi:hypothetical protein VTN00DRAFT_4362 [Thermoascus crustaceus]|uniref:uncharacterized protein n=1 Tax=Thermoascus crustaceus TaxID=5088 RepID=UPI0037433971
MRAASNARHIESHLNRIVSMSGAAYDIDDDDDDDSDDNDDFNTHATKLYRSSSEILPWVPGPPSSPSFSNDDSVKFHNCVTTASTNPSLLKTQESEGQAQSAETEC